MNWRTEQTCNETTSILKSVHTMLCAKWEGCAQNLCLWEFLGGSSSSAAPRSISKTMPALLQGGFTLLQKPKMCKNLIFLTKAQAKQSCSRLGISEAQIIFLKTFDLQHLHLTKYFPEVFYNLFLP